MKEQSPMILRARRATIMTADCIKTEGVAAGATALGAVALDDLAKGNTTTAILKGGGALLCLGLDYVGRVGREKNIYEAGVAYGKMLGATEAPQILDFPITILPKGEAYYKSLNEKLVIETPQDLIAAIGEPRSAGIIVGRIVKNATKKNATLEETQLEYLRIIQAAFQHAPGLKDAFCKRGDKVIAQMDELVTKYEATYQKKNSPQP